MNKKFNLAIVGATGSVGREITQILEERNFPINELALVASSKSEGKKISFTILLTNSSYMKKLNNKFRNKNKSTDVLSFPFYTYKNLKKIKTKNIYIGDVAISYEKINAISKRNNFLLEFDKIWVHGLLHLLGHKHHKNKDYFRMNKIEKRIISLIN